MSRIFCVIKFLPHQRAAERRNWIQNEQRKNTRKLIPLMIHRVFLFLFFYRNNIIYIHIRNFTVLNRVSKKCSSSSSFTTHLKSIFPIINWLGGYKRDDLFGDIISGCTVAIMHIPQGMGYALLAQLPPVVGIYMAFYPVLMYILFGTSRHNSMG